MSLARPALLAVVVALTVRALLGAVLDVPLPAPAPRAPGEVSPERGESLFWSTGRCSICHSVGERGSEARCPNLGATGDQPAIGARAAERAATIAARDGRALDATGYLVESVTRPGAFVVDGYRDEMPAAHRPPIGLDGAELTSVILYLQSLGGTPDPGAIRLPDEVGAGGAEPSWVPAGDPARGRALFHDAAGVACVTCHRAEGEGGGVGPDLDRIGLVRGAGELARSVLAPSDVLVAGFDVVEVETTDGARLRGVLRDDEPQGITLTLADATVVHVERARVTRVERRAESLMPDNFGELLTVRDLADLIAYLGTLDG